VTNEKKTESLWSIAIEMANKIQELTGDLELVTGYRNRLTKAYWDEQDRRQKEWIKENGYVDPWG
jgi:hypothetical protein